MGSTFSHVRDISTKSEMVSDRTKSWAYVDEEKRCLREGKCLAHCCVGNSLWKVVERTITPLDPDGKPIEGQKKAARSIDLDVILHQRGDDYAWGYKDMGESMHPYYYTCPLSYLAMVPEECAEWRAKVREYHAQQKAAMNRTKGVEVGDTITLVGARIPYVRVITKQGRRIVGTYGVTNYRIPAKLIGEKLSEEALSKMS